MSQLIKVINRALFRDIKCIRDRYFPVAHDLVINHELERNRMESPMWSHSLVRLCRLDYLKTALQQGKFYDECAYIDEISRGDFCGFNFIETIVKSAIQARLSAILKSNTDSKEYIEDLITKIKETEILRVAQDYLDYYPFSLKAMESYLVCHLLLDQSNQNKFSCLTYDGYFSIITAYLQEGLYRKAYEYFGKIDKLEKLSQQTLQDFEFFSSSSLVKYELCKANYFYLFDDQDNESKYRWKDLPSYNREEFINQAWKSLEKAANHLKIRTTKYYTINEISQGIFHPHFILLAQINFLKAKLFLFFPYHTATYVAQGGILKDYHYARIYLLEQSRIYAAKNGDTVTYAFYTAYQVFAYIMTGYLVNKSITYNQSTNTIQSNTIKVDFTRENLLNWAKRLMNNAVICYEEFGRKCYYEIKEKSGISQDTPHGEICIEKLPLIREEQSEENQGYDIQEEILHLDMSLLCMNKLDDNETVLEKYVYLFGTEAATILFAREMYTLCGDENTNSIEAWTAKIHKAYRLFNYAWGIAENGCSTPPTILTKDACKFEDPCDEDNQNKITRPDFNEENTDDYPPQEVKTVRDLYPHGQSEIADLGKVYAIACLLHKLYLPQSQENKKRLIQDIDNLRNDFYKIHRNPPELVANQTRFNGHLRPYLNKIKGLVDQELERIENTKIDPDERGIKAIRKRIMGEFFGGFYNTVIPTR